MATMATINQIMCTWYPARPPQRLVERDYKEGCVNGRTALVTGASRGIGKASAV